MAALIIFSGSAKRRFVIQHSNTSHMLVEGGNPIALKAIMRWITSCCKDGRMIPFPKIDQPAFVQTWHMLDMARILEIPSLERHFRSRLNAIASDQVHFEDCRDIFTSSARDKKQLRYQAAESVALALFDGRLRNKTEYSMLRGEIQAFDALVRDFLAPLVAARNKACAIEEKKNSQTEAEIRQAEGRKMRWSGLQKADTAEALGRLAIIEEGEESDIN